MRIVVTGGTVVNADGSQVADVVVDGERITGIVAPGTAGDADLTLDASGRLVVPGGVDPHVHFDSPTQKIPVADDFGSGTKAAAFGGTTTVIDFAFQLGGCRLPEALDRAKARAAGRAHVDYAFHTVITSADERTLRELAVMRELGVTSYKLYMAYGRRGLLMDDAEIFRLIRGAAVQDALVMLHAENGPITELLVREAVERGDVDPSWHPRTRPELTEVEAIYRGLSIAELAGGPVYFVHVSTAGGVAHIGDARRRGRLVFGETCPHYLLLDESVYETPGFEAAKWVLTPPIRHRRNQDPLWHALAAGDLQVVATDHCPFCFAGGKDAGKDDFSAIPNGGPGVEHRMSLVFDAAVATGRLSVHRWVDLMSTTPARLFGLAPQKGRVAVGVDADLVIFDPDGQAVITARDSHSGADYSMYEGRAVRGTVQTVLCRGEVIVDAGQWRDVAPRGQYIKRGPSGVPA